MRHPIEIPHHILAGRPRKFFGESASIGGHIRAFNVTDH